MKLFSPYPAQPAEMSKIRPKPYPTNPWVNPTRVHIYLPCPNGNYYGFCCKAIQLQTPLQTSQVIETVLRATVYTDYNIVKTTKLKIYCGKSNNEAEYVTNNRLTSRPAYSFRKSKISSENARSDNQEAQSYNSR